MVIFWNKTKQITCKHPHFGTTLKWICKSNNNCHIIIYVHLIYFHRHSSCPRLTGRESGKQLKKKCRAKDEV